MTKLPSHVVNASITEQPNRYAEGWRRGRPEEDPDKLKHWGWVAAKPSEFLIRMRGGTVVTAAQGATVFKWPWDSVSIVPTTVQRLTFTADQITIEKVGVRVTGIAVFRIVEPLVAFRMLNFSYPERAQEKLHEMMEEMCIGATRRLVANLTIEQCLTRRKDALATELIREIAPVVTGSGRVEDTTDRGWGVVVDTIEIQDVRVQSAAVFANMQARFREEQTRQAREAELSRVRAVKADETSTAQEIELSRVASKDEIRRQTMAAEEGARLEKVASDARVEEQRLAQERTAQARQIATTRDLHLAKLQAELEVRKKKQADDEALALEKLKADQALKQATLRAEVEAVRLEADAESARHTARLAEEDQAAELELAKVRVAQAEHALKEMQGKTAALALQQTRLVQHLELERASRQKEIDNFLSPEVIQLAVANQLPELAKAFQQNMGEVHVTAVDGANPFGYIAAAVEGVMGLARSAGLSVPQPARPVIQGEE